MRRGKVTKASTEKGGKESFDLHKALVREVWSLITSGLIGVLFSLFGMSLSFYVSQSKSPRPALVVSTAQTLMYFAGGIILLAIVTIGIASLLRRQNRDVIRLKQRLAEIYSVALRNSAFNPQLASTSSND
jgi:hypothetical protein